MLKSENIRTLVLLFTVYAGFIHVNKTVNSTKASTNNEKGQILINRIPIINDCSNHHYIFSYHDSIQSISAWYNSVKSYTFELNDSIYKELESEFELVVSEDQKIAINCIEKKGNWYQIKNKKGKLFWTSIVSYRYWCGYKSGEVDNITYKENND